MTTIAGTGADRPEATTTSRAGRVAEGRRALLFAAVLLTSIGGLAVGLAFPEVDADGFIPYATVAEYRGFLWGFLALAGVNLVVAVWAGALAALLLTPQRGSRWATMGAALMGVGAAAYGVGLGGWSTALFVATDPVVLDTATATALVEGFQGDATRMWLAAGAGAGLVALGTVLVSVGLWRARSVPRWVPVVLGVSSVATFVLPTSGVAGLITEGPVAVSSIAVGWYAWRGRRGDARTAVA